MIGAEHMMMGSDMPFPIGDTEPVKSSRRPVYRAGTDRLDHRALLAARLFKIA